MLHEEFEKNAMNMILAGEDNRLDILRRQYNEAKVASREFTGCGFFTYFDVPEALVKDNFEGRIADVGAKLIESNGEWIFFVLYIVHGKFDVLEGFTTGDSWDGDYNVIMQYLYESERKFEIDKKEIVLMD